jgi:hypothetical protein
VGKRKIGSWKFPEFVRSAVLTFGAGTLALRPSSPA